MRQLRSGEMFGEPRGLLGRVQKSMVSGSDDLAQAARPGALRPAPDGSPSGNRLSDPEIERHMRGYCGDLACRIHARTGLPLEAIEVQGVKEHFMVRLPNGNYLDARGELTPEQALQGDWFSRGNPRIVPTTAEEAATHTLRETGRDVNAGAEQYDGIIDRLMGGR